VAGPDGTAAGPDLEALISAELTHHDHAGDADVARLVSAIRARHGDRVAVVLLYGSYLRGKRDTLLDFYVLLDDLGRALPPGQAAGNRLLPPNVYYLALPTPAGATIRAKYATMSLDQFRRGMHRFHCYFWARFTQPVGLVWARDESAPARVAAALAEAVHVFVSRVAPLVESEFPAGVLWRRGFDLTYACELRSEDPTYASALYEHHAARFDRWLAAYARRGDAAVRRCPGGTYRRATSGASRGATAFGWRTRRLQGKALSVLRLVKAAATFDDPLDYLLWKIERHSGVYITPTDRQRRHPLVFAWPLLWALYRRGAFR
jgi:hypothetical protein